MSIFREEYLMSKAGRPAVPALIKELSGTLRKDRTREGVEFKLITKVPKPEVWLELRAKKYFKNICELLISNHLLNEANVPLVLIMAQEFATYEDATRKLKDEKKVIVTGSGYKQPNPWISIRNTALKNYKDIAGMFGLDPLSAQKIGLSQKETGDEFDKMQKKYK
jgi:P27 family predicted phage terminase small subunit